MKLNSDMVKSLTAVKALMTEMLVLGEDALAFVSEKELWDEFMKFHTTKHTERSLNAKKP